MRLPADKNYLKRVTLLGTLLVIPWECLLIFGFTFSMNGNEPFWAWVFLFFAFFLNIPAVLLSWAKPKPAAYWIFGNITISMVIGAGFEIRNYLDRACFPGAFGGQALNLFAVSVVDITLFWLAPVAFAFALLTILDGSRQLSTETTAPEAKFSR